MSRFLRSADTTTTAGTSIAGIEGFCLRPTTPPDLGSIVPAPSTALRAGSRQNRESAAPTVSQRKRKAGFGGPGHPSRRYHPVEPKYLENSVNFLSLIKKGEPMTPHQREKMHQLENQLKLSPGTLPIRGECKGYLFTVVDGVTVLITRQSRNPNGGFITPSLHTYTEVGDPTNLHAAADARRLFDAQVRKLGDAKYPHKFGHRGPVIGTDWQCGEDCPCGDEPEPRREERSIGHLIKSAT